MRISDWSSDVCSSYLLEALLRQADPHRAAVVRRPLLVEVAVLGHFLDVVGHVRAEIVAAQRELPDRQLIAADIVEDKRLNVADAIGRASFRERVRQYV